jgi:hypothetical protein
MTCVPSRRGRGEAAIFFRTLRRHAVLALMLAAFPAEGASAASEPTPAPSTSETSQDSTAESSAEGSSSLLGNQARIHQTGDENYVSLYQLGSGNVGTVVQYGGANALWLGQQALPGMTGVNSSDINQSGTQNTVVAWQMLGGNQNGAGMRLSIVQEGYGNLAEATQEGWANDGLVAQFGDNNWATLMQTGSLHESSIVQTGSGLSATSIQIGAGSLPISIQQTGDGAPSVMVTRQ